MIDDNKVLAIIPARGGSKRLLKKNVLLLREKPLITWTIEAGLKSKYIDTLIVSSDDKEILNISRHAGAKVIKRPPELATDESKTSDVIKHVIRTVAEDFDFIILLQPTSPLRTERHINEAFKLLASKNADAVISVCEVDHPALWCNTLPDNLNMSGFLPHDIKERRSQDLPVFYRINGAIYICRIDRFLKEGTFFINDNIYAYIMDKESSVDIDTYMDFKLADVILRENT